MWQVLVLNSYLEPPFPKSCLRPCNLASSCLLGSLKGVTHDALCFYEMQMSHVSLAYLCPCHMSNLRNDHVTYLYYFHAPVTKFPCCMLNLKKGHVVLSILRVKGHSIAYLLCRARVVTLQPQTDYTIWQALGEHLVGECSMDCEVRPIWGLHLRPSQHTSRNRSGLSSTLTSISTR